MTKMVLPVAIHAFFFPRRDAIFQNLVDKRLFLVRATAQADSHNATFACVLPFKLCVLFFYPHFHCFRVPSLPKRINGQPLGIDPYSRQSQQLMLPLSPD